MDPVHLAPLPSRYGSPTPVVRFGPVADEVGAYVVGRVLVLTDAGVRRGGVPDRLAAALGAAVFDAVVPDPHELDVIDVARAAEGYDTLVAVGGGSVLDAAKAASMQLGNGGRIAQWRGYGKAEAPGPRIVALPTTAGTGSEVQSFAIIARLEDREKMACGSRHAMPFAALVDPRLGLGAPRGVTLHAGVDALVHTLETAVTTARTPDSEALAQEAFPRLWQALPRALAQPDDLAARADLALGATQAGIAIEASMLGAAHACANPLSQLFRMPHGVAVGRTIGAVLALNAQHPAAAATYGRMASSIGAGSDARALGRAWVAHTAAWGLDPRPWLPDTVHEHHIQDLVTRARAQWTLGFNPVELSDDELARIMRWAVGVG